MDVEEALALLSTDPAKAGIFTDFDGTLSEIVDHPEDASAVDGAEDVLKSLATRFRVVAVVSGRALDDLRTRIDPAGLVLAGSYGRERSDRPSGRRAPEGWEPVVIAAAAIIEDMAGVVLERKGAGVAIHYRAAPDREHEVRRCAGILAKEFELEDLQGRLVVELVQPGPKKGDAVAAIASDYGLSTLLVTGDDVADAQAFEWARGSALASILVAVSSEEAPPSLEASADITVPGPRDLVALLEKLATRVA